MVSGERIKMSFRPIMNMNPMSADKSCRSRIELDRSMASFVGPESESKFQGHFARSDRSTSLTLIRVDENPGSSWWREISSHKGLSSGGVPKSPPPGKIAATRTVLWGSGFACCPHMMQVGVPWPGKDRPEQSTTLLKSTVGRNSSTRGLPNSRFAKAFDQ